MQLATRIPTRPVKRGRTTEGERGMILSLFLDGYRPSEIGEQFGRSQKSTEAVIEAEGYNPHRHTYTEAQAREWVKMYTGTHDGHAWSVAGIHRKTGYDRLTITRALIERGCRIRAIAKAVSLAHKRRLAMSQ